MKKAAFLLVFLSGCASFQTEQINLRNSAGQTVTCGPYAADVIADDNMGRADWLLRKCVEDFQRQGYERIQSP